MAFNNEVTEVVRYIEKNDRGDSIVVSRISDKESFKTVAIDIRQYYNVDGSPQPTRKGIRIPYSKFKEVLEVLNSI